MDDLGALARTSYTFYFPRRPYWEGVEILVAGCGPNQAAKVALADRNARVVGIDVSVTSLENAHRLKMKHALENLELHHLPIERVTELGKQFDLIVCDGVLHHLADPTRGARALAGSLKTSGAIELMLYSKYGRRGIESVQDFCRTLDLPQSAESAQYIRKLISRLGKSHPVRAELRNVDDLNYDAGVIDLFLNARERSYSVDGCLALLAEAGLVFQGWIDNAMYYPELFFPGEVCPQINALPEDRIWAAVEPLLPLNSMHGLVACRPERPVGDYRIDFGAVDFGHYVPIWNPDVVLDVEACGVRRHTGIATYSKAAAEVLRAVDGRTSVANLVNVARSSGLDCNIAMCRELFKFLWRAGAMFFRLPA